MEIGGRIRFILYSLKTNLSMNTNQGNERERNIYMLVGWFVSALATPVDGKRFLLGGGRAGYKGGSGLD